MANAFINDDDIEEVPRGPPQTPALAEWALPPVGDAAPMLCRQMTSEKFALGHEVLLWIISLGEQDIGGYVAEELTVFPVSISNGFGGSTTPTFVHYVRLGEDEYDGHDEPYDSTNKLHLQLVTLFDWWQLKGRELYYSSVVPPPDFS